MIRIMKVINLLFLVLFIQCYHTLPMQIIKRHFNNNEITFELPKSYIIEKNCMRENYDYDVICYKDSLNDFTFHFYKPLKEIEVYSNDSILTNMVKNRILGRSKVSNYKLEKIDNEHIYGYAAFALGWYKPQKVFVGYDKKTKIFFDIMQFTEYQTQKNEFKNFINIVKSIRVDTSAQH